MITQQARETIISSFLCPETYLGIAAQLDRGGIASWPASSPDPWQDSTDLCERVPPESPRTSTDDFAYSFVSSWGQLQETPLFCPDAPILVQMFTSAHICMATSKNTCPSAFHLCPGAHPTLPFPTCLDLTCPDNFMPAHSCLSTCTLLARVSLRPPGHLHNTPAQVHPHLPTFSRTCPGASAPHLLGCLQPASPAPPHLLFPAGQKSGQAEHPHLCRRRRSALPAPAAVRTFMGRALPAPRFPAGNRAPGLPHGRAGPPLPAR